MLRVVAPIGVNERKQRESSANAMRSKQVDDAMRARRRDAATPRKTIINASPSKRLQANRGVACAQLSHDLSFCVCANADAKSKKSANRRAASVAYFCRACWPSMATSRRRASDRKSFNHEAARLAAAAAASAVGRRHSRWRRARVVWD